MKPRLFFAAGAVLLAIASVAPIRAVGQTTANGPYYAWPAWAQQIQCDTPATCPRFVVLSNWRDVNFPQGGAAVLDRETGLVWERNPTEDRVRWFTAQNRCNALRTGNRMGWRLPTLQELASLVDHTAPPPGPTLPIGHPFGVDRNQGHVYWSATTLADAAFDSAYTIDFSVGATSFGIKPFIQGGPDTRSMWCVRGGQGVDPQ